MWQRFTHTNLKQICCRPISACPFPMDVVFALDSSSVLSLSDYSQQKNFVVTMINAFTISVARTHVGVITVGETARRDIELTQYTQSEILKFRVAELNATNDSPSDRTIRFTDMLKQATTAFKNGGRSQVGSYLFVHFTPRKFFIPIDFVIVAFILTLSTVFKPRTL